MLFPHLQRIGSFGATEAAMLHTGLASRRADADPTLLGKPLPGITLQLRDSETDAVITEPNRPGVLYVRGPTATGIWEMKRLPEKIFRTAGGEAGTSLSRTRTATSPSPAVTTSCSKAARSRYLPKKSKWSSRVTREYLMRSLCQCLTSGSGRCPLPSSGTRNPWQAMN